mmetsp:Transcript_1923/g.4775  ORF Transcript_1923/g.4775 Transcript_1923/m.4775 type:complete len:223 (+) Transcript_1923:154-822(+)
MCCAFRFLARSSILPGSSRHSARSMRACRLTDFFWASKTIAPPTARMSMFRVWKYCVLPKASFVSSMTESSLLPSSSSCSSSAMASMMLDSTNILIALNNRKKSKCVASAHLEQVLAAKSGNVKVPWKQVLILRTAASRGSSDSNKQTVPPTIAVCCQLARLILSISLTSIFFGCLFAPTWTCRLCSSSWSMVSLMCLGFPSVTLVTNCRNAWGIIVSGTIK